jgi:hypothetical protein
MSVLNVYLISLLSTFVLLVFYNLLSTCFIWNRHVMMSGTDLLVSLLCGWVRVRRAKVTWIYISFYRNNRRRVITLGGIVSYGICLGLDRQATASALRVSTCACKTGGFRREQLETCLCHKYWFYITRDHKLPIKYCKVKPRSCEF